MGMAFYCLRWGVRKNEYAFYLPGFVIYQDPKSGVLRRSSLKTFITFSR